MPCARQEREWDHGTVTECRASSGDCFPSSIWMDTLLTLQSSFPRIHAPQPMRSVIVTFGLASMPSWPACVSSPSGRPCCSGALVPPALAFNCRAAKSCLPGGQALKPRPGSLPRTRVHHGCPHSPCLDRGLVGRLASPLYRQQCWRLPDGLRGRPCAMCVIGN